MRMLRTVGRFSAGLLALILVAAGALIILSEWRSDRVFALPYPNLHASADSAVIARGQYLVYGPAHCADCHASPETKILSDKGREATLSGGGGINIFLGEIHFSNITSDSATGIGAISDGALARFFRNGVDAKGHLGLPFMMYANLTDADLVAMISFLRTLPPVAHAVPPSRYNVLGKITKAFFLKPFAPDSDPPGELVPGPTPSYGGYLVSAVANCRACHTARNMNTGEFTGPPLAGGLVLQREGGTDKVISPNLTPDKETGIITAWDEQAFIRRFQAGLVRAWSPMPWGPFSRMHENDLSAIYQYLRGLPPVHRINRLDNPEVP